jgi:hypothetical protein
VYLQEIVYDDVDWILLALDRVQWWAFSKKVNETSGFRREDISLTSSITNSFLRRNLIH